MNLREYYYYAICTLVIVLDLPDFSPHMVFSTFTESMGTPAEVALVRKRFSSNHFLVSFTKKTEDESRVRKVRSETGTNATRCNHSLPFPTKPALTP